MEKYKILKDLIGFNTIKDNQNSEIINYIEDLNKVLNNPEEFSTAISSAIKEYLKISWYLHSFLTFSCYIIGFSTSATVSVLDKLTTYSAIKPDIIASDEATIWSVYGFKSSPSSLEIKVVW